MNKQAIVVFDFDHTIIDGNAGKGYINAQLDENFIRKIITVLLAPLIRLLSHYRLTQVIGKSIPVYIATVGFSESKLQDAADRFSKKLRLFKDAVAEIERQQKKGRKILIISASPEVLIKLVIEKNKQDIDGIIVIASQVKKFFGGYIINQFCKGENKIKMAKAKNVADNWVSCYSDDYTDIPMFKRCKKRYIINPNSKTIRKISELFSDYQVLKWM